MDASGFGEGAWLREHGGDLVPVRLADLLSLCARLEQARGDGSLTAASVHAERVFTCDLPPERVFTCDLPRLAGYLPAEARVIGAVGREAGGVPAVDGLRPFTPGWTVRPGVLLRYLLGSRGISVADLADRAGLGPETVAGVLGGTVRVDGLIAARLGAALGGGGSFWLDVQAGYDADIERGAADVDDDAREESPGGPGVAARAAGYEVTAEVRMTHRGEALVGLPGEDELVPVPAAELAAVLGVAEGALPGLRARVTVRESRAEGRVLSGWRPEA